MQEESFEVQYTQEGERLDKVLSEIYPDFSRSFFQKLIKNKQIQVNGAVQKASYPVHTEDLIRVTIPDAVETTIEPENIPLDILYEDDDVLIVNKPKGMVVHPSTLFRDTGKCHYESLQRFPERYQRTDTSGNCSSY